MVQINFAKREVQCKIVYYGPARSGKTATLRAIHAKAPPAVRGFLTSIATDSDRTLFFDFLPLDLGEVAGIRTKVHIYSVPFIDGQNASRLLVLDGVDGIVFVADSEGARLADNVAALENLRENLKQLGRDLSDTALVFQWNRRDAAEVLAPDALRRALNDGEAPEFETVATEGTNVMGALKCITNAVLLNVTRMSGVAVPAPKAAAAEDAGKRPIQAPVAPRRAPAVTVPVPVRAPEPEPALAAVGAAPDHGHPSAYDDPLAPDHGEPGAPAPQVPLAAVAAAPPVEPAVFTAPKAEPEPPSRASIRTPRWRSGPPVPPPPGEESPPAAAAEAPASGSSPEAAPAPAPRLRILRGATADAAAAAAAGTAPVAAKTNPLVTASNVPIVPRAEVSAPAEPAAPPAEAPSRPGTEDDMDFSGLLDKAKQISRPRPSAPQPPPITPPRAPPRAGAIRPPPSRPQAPKAPPAAEAAEERRPFAAPRPAAGGGWDHVTYGERHESSGPRPGRPRPPLQSSRDGSADRNGADGAHAANLVAGAVFAMIALAAIGYLVYAML